jgi:predicted Zn finger-like uncharacterized protein
MPASLDCPGIECWQALLGDNVPASERDSYERHLESCPTCQQRLHLAEECGEDLRQWARRSGDPTMAPEDPALAQMLERLRGSKSLLRPGLVEAADLYFLQPSDQPGVLGTLGEYEVQEVIGQGGMGIVLKAFEPALHRLVAIKVLSPALAGSANARRRFSREAQAAAAVCHEHVVAVHGVHESDGLPYLVMQYVAGESLQARLDRSGPLEVVEIVRIGLQTAQGLAAAHAQGLIHRDVKPANLLLENGLARVKITDFGLARMADDVQLTRDGVVAGTPEYMAPEQARGEAVDHRADLFSLGSVLNAMCTGMPPFRGSTALAVLRQVSEEEPKPIRSLNPDVPDWLERLITLLMAKDPGQRFQSATEVVQLLEGYLAHLRQPATFLAPPLPARSRAVPNSPRRRTPWSRSSFGTAVAILALVSLGLGGWLAAGGDSPAPNAAPREVYLDFRGGKLPPEDLTSWEGSDHEATIEPEEPGLRISLPADHHHKYPVGVRVNTTVKGDFEITGGYEIVHAVTPRQGYGVGYEIYIPTDSPAKDAIAFARVRLPNDKDEYICTYMTTPVEGNPEGKRRFHINQFKAGSTSGRLRLTRKGNLVIYSAAEGDGGEFRELCRHTYCPDDLKSVRVAAYPGMAPEAVDVRLVDVRVGAEKPVLLAAAPNAEPARGLGKGIALAAVLGLFLAVGLGAWLLRARRAAGTTAARAAADPKVLPEPAAQVVSLACPDCKAKVRAKASLAGKKVKCPKCGKAILVPASDALRAGLPPS